MKYVIAFAVSLTAMFILMPSFIKYLKKLSFRQSVSEYALEDDKKKAGTHIKRETLNRYIGILKDAKILYECNRFELKC